MKTSIRETLARNLRYLMGRSPELNTQPKLAKKAGVSQSHISYMLRPETNYIIKIHTLETVASGLSLEAWHLLLDHETFKHMIEQDKGIDIKPKNKRERDYLSTYQSVTEDGKEFLDSASRMAKKEYGYGTQVAKPHRHSTK